MPKIFENLNYLTAYISPEYGLFDNLHIYSGGLGILAGDHLRQAAADNYPIAGFGLLYSEAYFHQSINEYGWQSEAYIKQNYSRFQFLKFEDSDFIGEIILPEGKMYYKVLDVPVGENSLFLLTTDIDENKEFRNVCDRLYGGSRLNRLRQELLLGFGSAEVIEKFMPKVKTLHINEGHAAFAYLARAIDYRDKNKVTLEEAFAILSENNLFTTHTPIIHGNEKFEIDVIIKHLEALALTSEEIKLIIKMGDEKSKKRLFSLPAFAIRNSSTTNTVSKLHNITSSEMWKNVLQDGNKSIKSITNGIDTEYWLDENMSQYVNSENKDLDLFLRCKQKSKDTFSSYLNKNFNLKLNFENSFIIGFARRFAPYKRANLIFKSLGELQNLFNKNTNLYLFIAGKAHPNDVEGKEIIQDIYQKIKQSNLEKQIFILENYDIEMAKHLIPACNLWLNTPLKPMEACGTSGMKAGLNGAVNLSILDGWWQEAYDAENGYAIKDELLSFNDREISKAVINIIQNDVLNDYNDLINNKSDIFLKLINNGIETVNTKFNTRRMFSEYKALY